MSHPLPPQTDLQSFLLDGGTLDSLKERYFIKARRHKDYNNLVLFSYDQINSPFDRQIVRESRGIILDEANNWKIVSRSFDKFFNYGEGRAANIDWHTAKVFTKMDGSLATLFPYDGKWHMATTGSADASGSVGGFNFTFSELFWKTFKYDLPDINCNKSFMFELVSIYNKVVVRYPEPKLVLLGARDLTTQQELSVEEASAFFPGCEVVQRFPFKSIEECTKQFDGMSPFEQEGFVVVDDKFNRIKLKLPEYVKLHHMLDNILRGRKSVVDLARMGETSEIVNYFPEWSNEFKEVNLKLDELVAGLETIYLETKDIPDQKEFAIKIAGVKGKHALFALRNKKTDSIKEYIKNMRLDDLMLLLGFK